MAFLKRNREEGKSDAQRLLWDLAGKFAPFILDAGENRVFSPTSVYEALNIVRLGSAGATKRELEELLGATDVLKGASAAARLGLSAEDRQGSAANAAIGVWLDLAAKPDGGFVRACSQKFANVARIDFHARDAGGEVSAWISEQTRGLLHPTVEVDSASIAYIASALYLKSAWVHSFDLIREQRLFRTEEGEVEAAFMGCTLDARVRDERRLLTVDVPLCGDVVMRIAVPREGVSLRECMESGEVVRALSSGRDDVPEKLVRLEMPKFSCEGESDLSDFLGDVGIASWNEPDLRPMAGRVDGPVFAVNVIHGARIAVDEEGIEAAACTHMGLAGCPPDLDPPEPTPIVMDRPFAFAIVSLKQLPVFLGTVAKPDLPGPTWRFCGYEDEDGIWVWPYWADEVPGVCKVSARAAGDEGECLIEFGLEGHPVHVMRIERAREGKSLDRTGKDAYNAAKQALKRCLARKDNESFDADRWLEMECEKWTQGDGGAGSPADQKHKPIPSKRKEIKMKRNLTIVCGKDERKYASYLQQLVSSDDDEGDVPVGTKDGMVSAAVLSEEQYLDSLSKLASTNYILFIGNGKAAKAARVNMEERFGECGMHYGWLGRQAYMYVEPSEMRRENLKRFKELCEEKGKTFEKELDIRFGERQEEGAEEKPSGFLGVAKGIVTTAFKPVATAVGQVADLGNDFLQSGETRDQQYTLLTLILYLDGLNEFLGE